MPRRKQTTAGDETCAIAYLRKSKDDSQNDFGAQRDAITAWAASHGVQVLAWHSDEGVSGDTSVEARAGLLQALDALREHGAGLLLAAKIDRISRDVVVGAIVEREVQRAGARVVTADGVDPSSTPMGELIRNQLRAFAQFELAMIRLRTREKLAAKKRRGEKLGGQAPFGYRAELVGNVKMLREDTLEQSALRRMHTLRAEGRTFDEIAKALDAGNHACRGKRWHASSVLRALRAAEQRASTQA